MKYNPNDFDDRLKEEIENVDKVYAIYKQDEDDKIKYYYLKKAVYDLSLAIKTERVSGIISPALADEMNEYFWSLLL